MAQRGGVHTTINVMVGVGVGVSESVSEGVLVGTLNQPPFLLLKEMMITPRMMVRMARMPIMVLDFIRSSDGFTAQPASRYRVHDQWR